MISYKAMKGSKTLKDYDPELAEIVQTKYEKLEEKYKGITKLARELGSWKKAKEAYTKND